MEVVYYCGIWNTIPATGDGFCLYAGCSTLPETYANSADGGLKFRLFTYNGLASPNQGGACFFVGSTKSTQGKEGNSWSIDRWSRYTIEVCGDKVTNKRWAVAYIDYDTTDGDYGSKRHIAAMDVTSWIPGGNNFGFYCSTGGARSNQYINSIKFEAL